MTRDEALNLVRQYTKNENLLKHMLAVEAAMKAYANKFGEDEEEWGNCGLLHDFDYEKMGSDHPSPWGYEILRQHGVSEDTIIAIQGHADRSNPDSRPSRMAKALFAVDELTGLIVATAMPRPNQISDLELKSVKKKFKDKGFAKGVNRDDIIEGCKELEVELDDHIQFTINALREIKDDLGLK
jgi:putative nucleotidyltransferase with HDIG domain